VSLRFASWPCRKRGSGPLDGIPRSLRSVRYETSFESVDHFVGVVVSIGGRECRFLVDSGIGVTVIGSDTADAVGVSWLGRSFSGQRMSGQEVTAPLVRLPEVSVGGYTVRDHVAGVIDLGSTQGGDAFDGILGLDFFANVCVTVDPGGHCLTVSDAGPDTGIVVPVEVRRDGGSVAVFAPLELPSGRMVSMEVDTGSAALILDDQCMRDCAVAVDDPHMDTREEVDETGYLYTRRFVRIAGNVRIPNEPETVQHAPRVMFQQIIHDGLIGTDFLNRFRYTFDVPRQRMVLDHL
jgi:hypothetical protein